MKLLILTTVWEDFMPSVLVASAHGKSTPHPLILHVRTPHNLKAIARLTNKILFLFHYTRHFTEYRDLKLNVSDDGGEKHVYDVTRCKSGCKINKYLTDVKEKMRIRNESGISDNRVTILLEW